MELQIVGYPGDQDKKGFAYMHQGPVAEVVKTQLGGYVLYYDIDTTPGNSGSDVSLLDEDLVNKLNGKEDNYKCYTIGIHTASAPEKIIGEKQGFNAGTLITPEINRWMREEVRKYFDK